MQTGMTMNRSIRLSILLIVLVTCIGYGNSLRNRFVFDDFMVLVDNHYIRDVSNLPRLFSSDYFLISQERTFRPVAPFILFVQYSLFAYNPFGYHLTNLLVHIANAVLVFLLIRMLTARFRTALIAGLIFAVHPAISETVFCVSYMEDLWGLLFYLLTLIMYLRYRQHHNVFHAVLAQLFFACSLLAKEMGVTLLAVIPLIDLMRGVRRPSRHMMLGFIIPAVMVLSGYLVVRFGVMYLPEKTARYPEGSFLITMMNIPHVFAHYVKLCLLPVNLTADYEFPTYRSFFSAQLIGSYIWCGLLVVLFVKSSQTARFFMAWFVLNFLPVSNIIPFGAIVAERYLYFSAVGFAALAGYFTDRVIIIISQSGLRRSVILALCVAPVILCYSVLLMVRAPAWYNNESLWTATVNYSPRKYIQKATLFVNLGNVFYRNNNLDDALKAYRYARKLDPSISGIHNNIGIIYMEKGYLDLAKSEFIKAIELDDTFVDPYFSLTKLYLQRNDFKRARQTVRRILDIDAYSVKAYRVLIIIESELGNLDRALTSVYNLLEIDPLSEFAYYNGSVLYLRMGRTDLAKNLLERGLQKMPQNKALQNALRQLKQEPVPKDDTENSSHSQKNSLIY